MLAKALALAGMGYKIFPLFPNSKVPSIMKFPQAASTDPDQIRTWWSGTHSVTNKAGKTWSVRPDSNIGILTTDMCVIDVDFKDDPAQALVSLKELPPTKTLVNVTPTGGLHLIFKLPYGTQVSNATAWKPCVDIRGYNGYIVAPGSVVKEGEYVLRNPGTPVAMISLDLLEMIGVRKSTTTLNSDFGAVHTPLVVPDIIKKDTRDDTVFKVCCKWRGQNISREEALVKLEDLWSKIEHVPGESKPFTKEDLNAKFEQAWAYPAGTATTQLAAQIAPQLEAPISSKMDLKTMVERYVLIENGSFVGDLKTRLVLKLAEFKNAMKPYTTTIETARGPKKVDTSALWLAFQSRQTVWDTLYYPDEKASIKTVEKLKYFNIYRGSTLPVVECDHAVIAPFLGHVRFLSGSPESYETLLDWLAFSVQYPWRRITWAFMIVTPKYGVGKNPLFLMMQRVMGKQNVGKIDERDLDSSKNGFTGFMSGKTMLLVDECEGTAYEELKDFVTDNSRSINHKYGAQRDEDLYCSVLLFTNKADSLKIPWDDRRFYIAACYQSRKKDIGYYTSLFESLENDLVPAHFLAFLKARDVSKFGWNRDAEMTDAKQNMVVSSMTSAQAAIEEMFEDQKGPCMFDIITPKLALHYLQPSDADMRRGRKVTMSDITKYLGPHYLEHKLPLQRYPLPEPLTGGDPDLNAMQPRLVCIRNHKMWQEAGPAAVKLEYLRARQATIQTAMAKEKIIETITLKEISK